MFNFGIRWLNTGMTQGMRQAGNDFKSMIDTEVREVQRLNRELMTLKKTERAMNDDVRAAKSAYRARADAARAAAETEAANLRKIRADMASLSAQMRAQGRVANPAWEQWHNQVVRLKGEIRQLNNAEALRSREAVADVKNLAVTHKNALVPALEKVEQLQKRLASAQERQSQAKAALLKGEAAANPELIAHREKLLKLEERLQKRQDSLREAGWGLQDAQRERISASQVARKEVRNVRRAFRRNDMLPSDLPTIMVNGKPRVLADDFTPEGLRGAVNGVNAAAAVMAKRQGEAVAKAYKNRALLQIRKSWAAQAERSGINRARAAMMDRDDAASDVAGLRQERREITRKNSELRAEIRRVRRSAPQKLSPEALASARALDLADQDVSSARRALNEAERNAASLRDAHSRERAMAGDFHARAAATAAAAKASKQQELFDQGLEPARFLGDNAQKARFAQLAASLAAKLPGMHRLKEAWHQARSDKSGIAAAQEAHEVARKNLEAKAEEHRLAVQAIQDRRMEHRVLRDFMSGVKQELWGKLFDMSMKFGLVTGYINRLQNFTNKAAEFHYRAQGVSALLDGPTGTGQDIFSDYTRRTRYQGEVSPTEAMARMADLAAAGYSRSEIPRAMEALFNTTLAAKGEITPGGTFDLGISLDRAFGGQGKSMEDLLDTTVKAANKFPMTVGKARDALSYATEAAVTYNQSLEETLIGIGAVMPIAKTPSKAGTIVRNMMMSLAKPAGQKILRDYGVDAKDEQGQMRPFLDIYAELSRKFEDADKKESARIEKRRSDLMLSGNFRQAMQSLPKKQQTAINQAMAAGLSKESVNALLASGPNATTKLDTLLAMNMKPVALAAAVKKLLDDESIARLRMKKEQVEFQMTGQRGGAGFAALERMPVLARGALEDLANSIADPQLKERLRNAQLTTENAIALFRANIGDAVGETRRMADEMRRTSKMIGEAFRSSVERASIALGTLMLPVRDSLMATGKTALDWLTAAVSGGDYGKPGGSPPGGSAIGNLVGSAAVLFAGRQVIGMLGGFKDIFGQVRMLTSPKFSDAFLGFIKGGDDAATAAAKAAQGMQSVGMVSKLWNSSVVTMIRNAASWGLQIGAVAITITSSLKAASDAALDFSHITDRKRQRRVATTENLLSTLLGAAATRSQSVTDDGAGGALITGFTKSEFEAINKSPTMGNTLAGMIANQKYQEAINFAFGEVEAEIRQAYASDEPKMNEALKDLASRREIWTMDSGQDLLGRIANRLANERAGTGKPATNFEDDLARAVTEMRYEREMNPMGVSGKEMGGKQERMVFDFIKSHGAKTLAEAWAKSSGLERGWFRMQNDALLNEKMGMTGALSPFAWLSSATAGLTPDETMFDRLPKSLQEYDLQGRYIRGLGAPNVMAVSAENAAGKLDTFSKAIDGAITKAKEYAAVPAAAPNSGGTVKTQTFGDIFSGAGFMGAVGL
jgi:TP901 family phage tail tape measure protein